MRRRSQRSLYGAYPCYSFQTGGDRRLVARFSGNQETLLKAGLRRGGVSLLGDDPPQDHERFCGERSMSLCPEERQALRNERMGLGEVALAQRDAGCQVMSLS